jgi:biopolymer transport protein TolR
MNPLVARAKKRRRRHRVSRMLSTGAGAVDKVRSEINVTPLVDVVLVLLIIFMVVTPLLHRGVELELPKTKHHATRQDTGEQVVVSVRADGVFLEADKVDVEQLGSLLEKELTTSPSRPVNIHADRTLRFGDVRKVIEQVHASGAPAVNMETEEKKE